MPDKPNTAQTVSMNAFRGLIAILAVIGYVAHEGRVNAAELSEQDVKEIRRIERSLEDGSLPMPPGWTYNQWHVR